MPFEIVITEKREVKRTVGGDWAVVGTKEVARDESLFYRGDQEPRTRIDEVRGYTPQIEKIVMETREVLKQSVDELDLPSVIRAINKL